MSLRAGQRPARQSLLVRLGALLRVVAHRQPRVRHPWQIRCRGRTFMRIAVVGAGGIGAIYGAALAKAGNEVVFVARGAHLKAMQENGLRIEGDRGETVIRPARSEE